MAPNLQVPILAALASAVRAKVAKPVNDCGVPQHV